MSGAGTVTRSESLQLTDPRRLAVHMTLAGVSGRELARAAGWADHRYLRRLLAGERTGIRPEPAARIAERLGVDAAELFTPRATGNPGHADQEQAS